MARLIITIKELKKEGLLKTFIYIMFKIAWIAIIYAIKHFSFVMT